MEYIAFLLKPTKGCRSDVNFMCAILTFKLFKVTVITTSTFVKKTTEEKRPNNFPIDVYV